MAPATGYGQIHPEGEVNAMNKLVAALSVTSSVVGTFINGLAAYYAAATYYGWNSSPATSTGEAPTMISGHPIVVILALLVAGIALVASPWIAMYRAPLNEGRPNDVPSPPDILTSDHIRGGSYRIVDFVQDGAIRNRTFEGVTLYGPAVLAQGRDGIMVFVGDRFDNSADEVFLSLAEARGIAGMIPVINGTFRNCHLVNISIAGHPDAVARWRQDLGV